LSPQHIAPRLLAWFAHHGRHDLPWQHPATPYRVWVSEIMLQQTRVATVIAYFERFMQRFPSVHDLAQAELNEVLHYWSGLGYYSRARNLHASAQQIVQQWQGHLPSNVETLQSLPGIGRSTAGAIAALGYGTRCAILDGNVKRVLSRYHAIAGWPGDSQVAAQLWSWAEYHTPHAVAEYTQAIMDLGASVCTRSRPLCHACPLANTCAAYQSDSVAHYPAPKPRKILPQRTVCFMMLSCGHYVWLQQRPLSGIWGGLAGFPECPSAQALPPWLTTIMAEQKITPKIWPMIRHTFTHFHLDITPLHLVLAQQENLTPLENAPLTDAFWYDLRRPARVGTPAPVSRLLQQLSIGAIHDE